MNRITTGFATVFSLISTAAWAGIGTPVPVSEPGMLGLVAGGVIAAIAVMRLRGRK